jgi:leucyl aminopeptidase
MIKLNIKAGSKKPVFKTLSVSVCYVLNDSSLSNSLQQISDTLCIKIPDLQKKNLLSDGINTIKITNPSGLPDEVVINKIKTDKTFNNNFFRNQLAGFIKEKSKEEIQNIYIFLPDFELFNKYFDNETYFIRTFAEGLYYGSYSFENYKSGKKKDKVLNIELIGSDTKKIKNIINETFFIMEGVSFTRDLQNEPAQDMTPDIFAKKIVSIFKSFSKVKVKTFGEKEIQAKNMGGLWGVGKGAKNPPRLCVVEYQNNAPSKKKIPVIALVGKGITFDSGGISLKSAEGMGDMKADMSGAAVAAGAILSAARMELPVRIIGILPLAENMPSGSSFKPGDIITTASGKTVEIINTDAEGRLILADALHYAGKMKPDIIIDLATLTGACVVALGEIAAGLFTKNDKLAAGLFNIGIKTNERVWRMPMWEEYGNDIKSEIADIKNLGIRWGGASSAAKFLENFVDENMPWAHIDIAGPAIAHKENNFSSDSMTGFGVRLLIEFMLEIISGKIKIL